MSNNFERMLALVGEVFDVKNDPGQIDVDEDVIPKLKSLHEHTLSEFATEDGPVAWILLIPTTIATMNEFIACKITEKQLLDNTNTGQKFEAIYLCSATVLPEFRHKGIARKLTLDAVASMRREHEIEALYFWKFSDDGERLAYGIAELIGLPLYQRMETLE